MNLLRADTRLVSHYTTLMPLSTSGISSIALILFRFISIPLFDKRKPKILPELTSKGQFFGFNFMSFFLKMSKGFLQVGLTISCFQGFHKHIIDLDFPWSYLSSSQTTHLRVVGRLIVIL